MSSRKRSGRGGDGQPPTKRRRTDGIGSHKPEDDIPTPHAQANAPSASALSTRTLPPEHLPTLATLCVRVFAENLQRLYKDERVQEDVQWRLKELPDALSQKVFSGLKHICPTLLSHFLIVTVGCMVPLTAMCLHC